MANADIPHHLLEHHAYTLVDRALVDEVPHDLPLIALAPAFMEGDIGRCPGLVVLHELSAAQHVALLEHLEAQSAAGETPIICALLASQADVQTVRAHLINRLSEIRGANGRRSQFRFYDPRVFVQLPDILDGATLAALFGPIERWTYFLSGAWHSELKPANAATPLFNLSPPAPTLLGRVGIVNRVLTQLPAPPDPAGWRAMRLRIDALVARAQTRHRLRGTDDLVQFALHGVCVHERFDSHPRIAALIAGLQEHDMAYLDAAALLDEDDWQRIHTELNASGEIRI